LKVTSYRADVGIMPVPGALATVNLNSFAFTAKTHFGIPLGIAQGETF
jgi:hypothetical protein